MITNRTELMDEELLELELAAKKATQGPWYVPCSLGNDECFLVMAKDPETSSAMTVAHTRWPLTSNAPDLDQACHNAMFIAASRDLIPRLIQAYRERCAEVARLKSISHHAEPYLNSVDSRE